MDCTQQISADPVDVFFVQWPEVIWKIVFVLKDILTSCGHENCVAIYIYIYVYIYIYPDIYISTLTSLASVGVFLAAASFLNSGLERL